MAAIRVHKKDGSSQYLTARVRCVKMIVGTKPIYGWNEIIWESESEKAISRRINNLLVKDRDKLTISHVEVVS